MTRNQSRLSGQPVLSTRNLINKLSCKNEIDNLHSTPMDSDKSVKDELVLMTNYKDTFQIESPKNSKPPISSEVSIDSEKMDAKLETIFLETNQKILSKRNSIESAKMEKTSKLSIDEDNSKTPPPPYVSGVEIKISNRDFGEDKINTPRSHDYNERNCVKPSKSGKPKMISSKLKQISNFNESFQQNVIKIRRVFDGETLRINQMPLNVESRMDHTKRYINRRIKSAQSAKKSDNILESVLKFIRILFLNSIN